MLTSVINFVKVAVASVLSLVGFSFFGKDLPGNTPSTSTAVLVVNMLNVSLGEGSEIKNVAGIADVYAGDNTSKKENTNNSQQGGDLAGYLKFNQDVSKSGCNELNDCYSARWNKKPDGKGMEGYFSGWAKLEINSDLSEAWIHFKQPNDINNYQCTENSISKDQNYFACSDEMGNLYGYAKNPKVASTNNPDNPELGWLSFARISMFPQSPAKDNNNDNAVDQTEEFNKFCYISFDTGGISKTICSTKGTATFKCLSYGSLEPQSFEWQCDKNETPNNTDSPTHECPYASLGEKTPKLTVTDKSGEKIECQSLSKVVLTTENKCQLLIGKEGGSDFAQSALLFTGEKLETKLIGQCIGESHTNWEFGKLKPSASDNSFFQAPLINPGQYEINASVTLTNGDTVDCQPAILTVKEKLKWGQ